MFKLLLYGMLLLGYAGCSQPKPHRASWYVTPPHHTPTTLYGVGEGADFNAAKTMALAHLAHSLSMTLQSSFTKQEYSMRTNGKEQTLQEQRHRIRTEATLLHFRDVSIEQEQVLNGRIYLLVSVERARLYDAQEAALHETIETYQQQFESLQKQSSLTRFVLLKHINAQLPELKRQLELLKILDPTRDVSGYDTWIERYGRLYETQRHTLHLSLEADAVSTGFKEVFAEQLLALGVHVDASGHDGVIRITSKHKQEKLLGYYMQKCFVRIRVADAKGAPLASREYVLVGTSSIDFSQSHHNCVQQLASKVASEGIFKSLGL